MSIWAKRKNGLQQQVWRYIGLAFLFSVFVNLLMLTGPLFMLQVYDRVLSSRSEETLVALLGLVVVLYLLMWLLDVARSRILARFGARLQSDLEGPLFRASLSVRTGGGDSSGRDLQAVQSVFASPALTALLDMPFTPIFVAAIFIFHPSLGWLAVLGGAVLILIALANQMLSRKGAASSHEMFEDAQSFATSVRRGGDFVLAQGMLEVVTDRWEAARRTALVSSMRVLDVTGGLTSLSRAFRLTLQSVMLALGAWLVLRGELTAGAMIAASILLGRALAPIEQGLSRWPQIERARQGWRNVRALIETVPAGGPSTELPRPEGHVDVTGLTMTAPGRKSPLLFNVSFRVEPGVALGVIGRSGSGKTTVARALTNLASPVSGEVRLGGALLSQYGSEALGRYIGFLPQDPVLISGTIAENIARMMPYPENGAVVEAAKRAHAHDLILSLPQGYETPVGPGTRLLSGGQCQRIALARALFGDPVLLVLDEPNSALDLEGTNALNDAVRDMKAEGNAVIIMTHRPMAISECDRLIVLEQGRITASGPRDEVIKTMMKNAEQIDQGLRQRSSG